MRKLLPAVAVAFALGGTGALAGWRAVTVPGTPNDLQVMDAGHVVFSTSTGAYDLVFAEDGGVRDAGTIAPFAFIGAWHDYGGARPGALTTAGVFRWPVGLYTITAANSFSRMRHTQSGMGYAVGIGLFPTPADLKFEPTGGVSGVWNNVADPSSLSAFLHQVSAPVALSALRVGAADYALFTDDTSMLLMVDAGVTRSWARGTGTRDLHLFNGAGAPSAFVIPIDGGLELVPDVMAVAVNFGPVALPAGATDLRGVAFSLYEGSDAGRGFGVSTGTVGATRAILRSVPNPADAGRVWVQDVLPLPAAAAGSLDKVACFGSTFCAALVNSALANNVLVYWNEASPWIAPIGTIPVADNGSVTVTADAGDTDGDPVFLTWVPGGAYPVFVQTPDFDGRISTFTPDAGAFCGTTVSSYPYQVLASDGLASHVVSTAAVIQVAHSGPNAPVVSPPDASVAAGDPPLVLTASGDAGSCPITYTWSERTSSGFALDAGSGPVAIFYPPMVGGASCTPTTVAAQYDVRASDGPQSPPTTVTVWVTLPPGGVPARPELSPSGLYPVNAGDPPVALRAVPNDAGCAPTAFVWRERTDSGYGFAADGGFALFTPPTYHCSLDAGFSQYEVRAVNAVDASVPSSVSFIVVPWGAPDAPVFATQPPQAAGTSKSYGSLNAGHTCASAPGFPGMVFEIDGGTADVGVAADGGEIVVTSKDCIDDPGVTIQARYRVADAGAMSAWADLVVPIVTRLSPLDAGDLSLYGGSLSAGQYHGNLRLGAVVNCPERRALSAEVAIIRDGGGAEARGSFSAPGPFSLPVAGACNAGQYFVTAQLLVDGGTTGIEAQPETFSTQGKSAGFGEISARTLYAACGRGAAGPVEVLRGDFCESQSVTWEQIDGPALTDPVLDGYQVQLQTAGTGLDELIGQKIRLRVTADAGAGNSASDVGELTIEADPRFVTIHHRTDSPIADESGIVSVAVTLRNETACDVTGVAYVEQLDGLRFVPGTARFHGQPVEATAAADALTVAGLDLPANATRELVYSARPPMLSLRGKPAPAGRALLREVEISATNQGIGSATRGPPPGCGCGGAPSDLTAVAALVLAAMGLGRRRRAL